MHRSLASGQLTVLAYATVADLVRKPTAPVRIPQRGAWLSVPVDGKVYAVASDPPLDHDALDALTPRAPDGAPDGKKLTDEDA